MKFKLICCNVLMRNVCLAIAKTPHIVDPEFTELGAHENSNSLRMLIQRKIDETEGQKYDAILLGYGLCGNSTAGLIARSIPLVIPKAHDCCTLFLGSRERFAEYFGDNLSSQWSSEGYMERCGSYLRDTDTGRLLGLDKEYEEYVALYGEDNARYIWETLHPRDRSGELVYIETPGLEHLGYLDEVKKKAEEEGKRVKRIQGDMRLIEGLLKGEWDEKEFLIVPPGRRIKALYGYDVFGIS